MDTQNVRTYQVEGVTFNINALSEHQFLKDFTFKNYQSNILCSRLAWSGTTTLNYYRCDRMTSLCSILHRLVPKCRWYDVEIRFGFFTSQLSEIFWENVELFSKRMVMCYRFVLVCFRSGPICMQMFSKNINLRWTFV